MMKRAVAQVCISLLLLIYIQTGLLGISSGNHIENLKSDTKFYNPNERPRTFEDLFLPHWFENGTYSFDVPEYGHKYLFDFATTWAKYYQYGYEKGRKAEIKVSDDKGNVYLHTNNSNTVNGTPIGGPGLFPNKIGGSVLYVKVQGKILFQIGLHGDWVENIIEGGKYSITFSWGKVSLFMDYYNPTDVHTFYFKASKPIYAYLIGSGGELMDYIDKPVKEGHLTEAWDSSPFLTFIRPEGVEGNITVEFWAGYEPPKQVDYTGVLLILGIITFMVAIAYIVAKRSVYGKRRRA